MLEFTKYSQVLIAANEIGYAGIIGKDIKEYVEIYTNCNFVELKKIQQIVCNRVYWLEYSRKIVLDPKKTFFAVLEWLENNAGWKKKRDIISLKNNYKRIEK